MIDTISECHFVEVNEQSKRHIQELQVTEQLFRSLRFLLLEFFMVPKSHGQGQDRHAIWISIMKRFSIFCSVAIFHLAGAPMLNAVARRVSEGSRGCANLLWRESLRDRLEFSRFLKLMEMKCSLRESTRSTLLPSLRTCPAPMSTKTP